MQKALPFGIHTGTIRLLWVTIALVSLSACGLSISKPGQGKPIASNSVGDHSAISGLTYAVETLSLTKRQTFPGLIPTVSDGTATNFSISPALPPGMSFNVKTGEISGTPLMALPQIPYVISANNSKTTVRTTLNIEVLTTDPAHSKIELSSPETVANGTSKCLVTLTLLDKNDRPVTSEPTRIQTTRGAAETVETLTPITDQNGVAQFTIASTFAGLTQVVGLDVEDRKILTTTPTLKFIPGPAHHFTLSQNPTTTLAGLAFAAAVTVRDQNENILSDYGESAQITSSDPRALFPRGSSSFANGVALFSGIKLLQSGAQSITISDGNLTVGPTTITVLPAQAHHLSFLLQPSNSGIAGAGLSASPSVGIFDEFGNLSPDSSKSITLGVSSDSNCSNPLPGSLSASQNPVSTSNGSAAFSNLIITSTAAKRILATSSGGLIAACSDPISVSPDAPSSIQSTIQGSGPTIADGTSTLSVGIRILDRFSNPIPGITPSFSATDTGATNRIGTCAVTDSSGSSICSLRSTHAETKALKLESPVKKAGDSVVFKNGPATQVLLSGFPLGVTAGTVGGISVSVLDANNNPALDYTGTLRFTSTDPKATLPPNFAFSPNDRGVKNLSGVSLKSSGTHSIIATDILTSSISGLESGIVVASDQVSASHSTLTASKTTINAAESITLTLTAKDNYDNLIPGNLPSASSVQFSASSIGGAGNLETTTDRGSGVYTTRFTAIRNGAVTLSATLNGSPVGNSVTATIIPGSATHLVLTGIGSPILAGSTQTLTVTAKDSQENTVASYGESITLSASDMAASLDSAAIATNGSARFTLNLKTAGEQKISASDGVLSSESLTTVVAAPYSLSKSELSLSKDTVASNHSATLTLTAKDLYGNSNPSGLPQAGYILFTSGAGTGSVAFSALQDQGGGIYTATVTGVRSGAVNLGASISNAAISNERTITITPDSATRLVLTGVPASITAGSAFLASVAAYDSNGNLATGYSSLASLSSSDPSLNAPNRISIAGGQASGISIGFKTSGSQTLTLDDGTFRVTSNPVTVNPGAASQLVFGALPQSSIAGSIFTYSVTARDAFNNLATGYSGTIQFSSSDPQASLPSSPALNAGTGSLTTSLKTSGNQTITVQDGTLSTTSSPVAVSSGPYSVTRSEISTSSATVNSGSNVVITLTPKDAYGNQTPSGLPNSNSISFASSLTGGTGSFGPVSLVNGGFQSAFTGIHAGITAIGASISGVSVTDATQVLVSSGDATHLTITGLPASAPAGTALNFTVTAKDANGNTATGYSGSLSFASNDSAGDLPATTPIQGGSGSFSSKLKTSGSRTLTASDGSLSATSDPVNITPSSANALILSNIPLSTTAGSAFNFVVTARDSYGNIANGYSGPVSVASSDPGASLPQAMTLANGTGSFPITLKTAGSQSLSITDGSLTASSASIPVSAASAARLVLESIPASAVSGTLFNFSVTAKDSYGNIASAYPGSISITSSDSKASVPSPATLVGGTGSFAIQLKSAGSQTLGASDGSISVTSSAILVSASSAASLVLSSVPASVTAGSPFNYLITAKDSSGNTATSYSGSLSFSSSDQSAILPASSSFANGVASFTSTLKTSGAQTLNVTDGGLSTSSGPITVNPGDYSTTQSIITASSASVTAGSSIAVTLTTKDAYGNLRPSGLPSDSAITFTSSSVGGTGTFGGVTNSGNGVYSASFTGVSSGSVAISATLAGTIVASSTPVSVTSGPATRLVFGSTPQTVTAGGSFNVTVTAKDANGNTATGYAGSVSITSSDSQSILPPATSLTSGNGTFLMTLKTSGSQTLTASDGTLSVTSSAVSVSSAPVASLVLTSVPPTSVAGDPFTFTVTAKDPSGNTATSYTGSVAITSSDSQATLPATATLINGTGSFPVTLKTAGTKTITASDGTRSTTSGLISIGAGAYSTATSTVTLSESSISSGSGITATLTAKDAYGNSNPSGLPALSSIGFSTTSSGGTGTFGAVSSIGSGVYTSTFTGVTAGSATITASISGSGLSKGSPVTVTSGPATQLVLSGVPATSTANAPFTFTITAKDANQNIATSFPGTVSITTSDPNAILPDSSTLSNGSKTFSITLKTSGNRTLSATASGLSSNSSSTTVSSSGISRFVLSGIPSSIYAGSYFSFTVTAVDSSGNTATGYNGQVRFSSSDSQAYLPPQSALSAGVGNFTANLKRQYSQTLTVSDGTYDITSNPITINPVEYSAAYSYLSVSAGTTTSGKSITVSLIIYDRYGNSGASGCPAPEQITFQGSSVGGTGTFSPTTSSSQSCSYQATFTGQNQGQTILWASLPFGQQSSNSIPVFITPGTASRFVLSGYPGSVYTGAGFDTGISALDDYGNLDRTYSGTIQINTLSDAVETSLRTVPMDGGTGAFTSVFDSPGNYYFAVSDGKLSGRSEWISASVQPKIQTYPWVSVQSPKHHCTGAVLQIGKDQQIATPAHCIHGFRPEELKIIAPDREPASASTVREHDQYKDETREYDLALIPLPDSLKGLTSPILFPDDAVSATKEMEIFNIGWQFDSKISNEEMISEKRRVADQKIGPEIYRYFDSSVHWVSQGEVPTAIEGGAFFTPSKTSANGYSLLGFNTAMRDIYGAEINLSSPEISSWIRFQGTQGSKSPPWVAVLNPDFNCTGVLLDVNGAQGILTPAHCVHDFKPADIRIAVPDQLQYSVSSVIENENYDPKSRNYDLALLLLSEDLSVSVTPISYPSEAADGFLKSEPRLFEIGWAPGAQISSEGLLKVSRHLLPSEQAYQYFHQFNAEINYLSEADQDGASMEGGVTLLVSGQAQSGYLLAGLNTVGGVKSLEISTDLTHPGIRSWIEGALASPASRSVALINTPDDQCAGALIGLHSILVRANCIDAYKADTVTAFLGVKDPTAKEEPSRQVFRVTDIILHPDYNPETLESNLAVLTLDGDVVLGDSVQVAGLPGFDPSNTDLGSRVTSLTWHAINGKERVMRNSIFSFSTQAWNSNWDGNQTGITSKREFLTIQRDPSKGYISGMNGVTFSLDGSTVLGLAFGIPSELLQERNVRIGDYQDWIIEASASE